MSDLEKSLETIWETYKKYASKDGHLHTMSKKELKDLLKNELGGFLEKPKGSTAENRIMKEVEGMKGNIDFSHFGDIIIIIVLAMDDSS